MHSSSRQSATNPIRHGPGTGAGFSNPFHFPFLRPAIGPDEIGRLGNYRVLRLLGKGGMAFVFLAEDIALQRQVALKVMKPDLEDDLAGWQRFLREARILASVKHDHLVSVFQVGQEDNVVFLAMEFLEGQTLEDRLDGGASFGLPEILRIGREIALGLDVIHQQGTVHRDIKPANLWIESPSGRVKLLDFGLARLVHDDAGFTHTGMIVGTPAFMSPEQARGDPIDARSDLFSLGGVLYCLCTGTRPFEADNTMAVLTALALRSPRPVHEINPELPRSLSDLVMRLLEKDPDDRPGSAMAVKEELETIETGLAVTPRRREANSRTRELPPAAGKPRRRKKASLVRQRSPNRRRVIVFAAVALLAMLATAGAVLLPPLVEWMGGRVYLSEMTPIESTNWLREPPAPPGGANRSPAELAVVHVGGRPSPHGIFMHPPRSPLGGVTRITYRLDRQYSGLAADVSINDGPTGSDTPLTFSVYGDGRLLWQSREVRTQADTQSCRAPLRGVDVVTIEVNCPGPSRGAHAVWIEPRLAK